jgi:hypothetical protein
VVPFVLGRLVVARRVLGRRFAWPLLAVALRPDREGCVVLAAIDG